MSGLLAQRRGTMASVSGDASIPVLMAGTHGVLAKSMVTEEGTAGVTAAFAKYVGYPIMDASRAGALVAFSSDPSVLALLSFDLQEIWSFEINESVRSVAATDHHAYVVHDSGMSKFDIHTGAELASWSSWADRMLMVADDDHILLNDVGYLTLIDPGTGEVVWSVALQVGVVKFLLYQGDPFVVDEAHVTRFDVADGSPKWVYDIVDARDAAIHSGMMRVLVGSGPKSVEVINLNDGSFDHNYSVDASSAYIAITRDGHTWVAGNNGWAYRMLGTTQQSARAIEGEVSGIIPLRQATTPPFISLFGGDYDAPSVAGTRGASPARFFLMGDQVQGVHPSMAVTATSPNLAFSHDGTSMYRQSDLSWRIWRIDMGAGETVWNRQYSLCGHGSSPLCMAIDENNEFIYLLCNAQPGHVHRIRASDGEAMWPGNGLELSGWRGQEIYVDNTNNRLIVGGSMRLYGYDLANNQPDEVPPQVYAQSPGNSSSTDRGYRFLGRAEDPAYFWAIHFHNGWVRVDYNRASNGTSANNSPIVSGVLQSSYPQTYAFVQDGLLHLGVHGSDRYRVYRYTASVGRIEEKHDAFYRERDGFEFSMIANDRFLVSHSNGIDVARWIYDDTAEHEQISVSNWIRSNWHLIPNAEDARRVRTA